MFTKASRTENSRARVLIVEDDAEIGRLLVAELTDAELAPDWAANGSEGLEKFSAGAYGLIVLDLNLPGLDGLEVCRRMREADRYVPILMLTARAAKQDIVRGLELGADEYLTKPFSAAELVARIKALFRRIATDKEQHESGGTQALIQRGPLYMNPNTREARIDDEPVTLTLKEFELLLLFARHPGKTFSRAELLNRIWGAEFDGYEHTVNTHINRLRNKIEADAAHPKLIITVWGLGYRFGAAAL